MEDVKEAGGQAPGAGRPTLLKPRWPRRKAEGFASPSFDWGGGDNQTTLLQSSRESDSSLPPLPGVGGWGLVLDPRVKRKRHRGGLLWLQTEAPRGPSGTAGALPSPPLPTPPPQDCTGGGGEKHRG